jgi:peptidyl-prolyl cis-trans isomerase A (cyclophilin A)
VENGLYGGGAFYRAVRPADDPNPVKVAVIQGGLYRAAHAESLGSIAHESTQVTGLRHDAGTLSMARNGVGTADSEFFIVAEASPHLNAGGARQPDGHGFAAFGRVVAGMAIVRAIQARAQVAGADLHGTLTDRVPIISMQRLAT